MATTTWNVSKDSRIAVTGTTYLGAGATPQNQIGLYNNYLFRTLLGFSYSFTGMTAITAATLHVKTSSQVQVVFGASPDIYVRRLTSSWSEGTANSPMSSSNAVTWSNQPSSTSTHQASGSLGTAENTWKSFNITALIQDAFAAGVFYGLVLMAQNENGGGDVSEIWAREHSTSEDAYISVTYSTNTAPNAPTSLSPTGGAVQNTLTPTFSGTFSDPDAGDTMYGYQIQVSTDSTFASVTHWDSTTATTAATSFSKTYAGTTLSEGVTYYWRARTKDAAGAWGSWSTAQQFAVNSVPNAPSIALQESPTTDVTTLTPHFLVTHSDPDSADTKAYAYHVILETSDGTAVWDSGDVALGTPATTVTVTYPGAPALSWGTAYRWRARTKDRNGAWGSYSTNATFTTRLTSVPTGLSPTGGATASSTTPTLTGSRGSANDSLTSAQIQVYDSTGTTLVWDSGTFTSGVTSTAFSKQVGSTLTAATTYTWRARVTASVGGTSNWSALQTFVTPAATTPSADSPVGNGVTPVTNLVFTFSRATSFNRHELYLYSNAAGTVLVTSDLPSSYTATTSNTFTYTGTLSYGTTYYWKVRVSADGGTNWSAFTGLVGFTTDIAGIPTLTAPVSNSWETTLTPTFTGNTYNSEVISTFRIILYASDQTTQVWDSGNIAGSSSSFSKVYNGATALTKGSLYYWKASYVKSGGIPGGYSALESFHINADPNAPTSRTPATGYVYADDASPVAPRFYCDFSDSDRSTWGDYPTNFEVEVQRNSDGVQMYVLNKTTGLSGSTNDMADGDAGVTKTVGAGGASLSAETEYKWRSRYTDSKSAVGAWSSFNVFKPSQAPSAVILTPGATVGSPSFLIDWTFSSPGSKAQGAYRVRVLRNSDSVAVYDTTKTTSSTTSFTIPGGYLVNNTEYTIEVTVWDTDDLQSAATTTTTTSSWTAPDALTNFAAISDNATSTVLLTWDQSNLLSADFSYYQLYRREPGDTTWTKLDTVTTQTVSSYKDYFAAQGVSYDYKMTVFKKVPGDVDLESPDSDISSVVLDSDTWFVIGADRSESHSFELPVTRAPFSEPIQQEVFEPLGSKRKTIIRGQVLGAEGTLECLWDQSETTTAKTQVAYIRDNKGPHILKSPFGDVWEVEFSGPSKDYQAAGHLKVALNWTEVD